MDFNVAIQILTKSEIWNKYTKNLFGSEISTPDQLRMSASKLWDYRSNKTGHKRSNLVVYSRHSENIIKGYYQIISNAVLNELDKIT